VESGGVRSFVAVKVHDYTMTDEAEYVKPKKRVY
jgi:hypothetical protein